MKIAQTISYSNNHSPKDTNSNGTGYLSCHATISLLNSIKEPIMAFVVGDTDQSNTISAAEFDAIAIALRLPLGRPFFEMLLKTHIGFFRLEPSDGLEFEQFVRYMIALQKMDAMLQSASGYDFDYRSVAQASSPEHLKTLVLAILTLADC